MPDLDLIASLFLTCPVILGWLWGMLCCCPGCVIFTDEFTGTDEGGWTQTAGTWVEDSGYMATSSSDALLDCDTAHPDSVPSHYVSVSMYGANSDELRVHVGTTHFAEVTIGSPNGCLALYDGATLLTKMRIDAPATTAKTLKVWYGLTPAADGADSQFAAQWDSGDILRYNVTRAGNTVALGTGTVGSTVRFDSFRYEKHYAASDTSCKKPAAPTCSIISDNMDRADSSDIGCGLTETAGSWSIVGNKLRTSSGTAKVTCETVHPQESGAMKVSAVVRSSAADDQIKVFTDAANNTYAQLTIGTSKTLKLFAGGVEQDSVAFTTTVDTDYTMTVWHADGGLSVQVSGGVLTTTCLAVDEAVPAGPVKAGLGTGTVSGNVDFNNLVVSRAYDANNESCDRPCAEPCDACDDVTTLLLITLEFTGFANGSCTDCADWNATSVEVPIGWSGPCGWVMDSGFPACSAGSPKYNLLSVAFVVEFGTYVIYVNLQEDVGGATTEWRYDTGEASIDCLVDLVGLEIPLNFGTTGPDTCDTTAATCTITAVQGL